MVPAVLRRKLRLRPGDRLAARLHGGSLVLTPDREVPAASRIVTDRRTRLAYVKSPHGAAKVTSEEVRALMAEFP